MISVVYAFFNEDQKLENSLKSIEGFGGEVVIVDLGSSPTLQKIAKRYQAKVCHHPFVPFVEQVRNFSLEKTRGDWILVLDPDEELPMALKEKLKEVVQENLFSAVNIPRKNIFFGQWIAHTNWWPDRHIRFFKKGAVRWSDRLHSYPAVAGKILRLDANPNLAIIHHGYDSVGYFLERQSRYSSIEAEQKFKMGEKVLFWNFFYMPAREFLVRYLRHAGFLDGFHGLALTLLMMIYQLEVLVKLWEKGKK